MNFKILSVALGAVFLGTISPGSAALVTDTYTGFASSAFPMGANSTVLTNVPFVATYTFDLAAASSTSDTFTGVTTASLRIGGQSVDFGSPSGTGMVAYSPTSGIFQNTFYGPLGYLTTSISLLPNTTSGLGTSFYALAVPDGFNSGSEYNVGGAPIVFKTTSLDVTAVPLPASLPMFAVVLLGIGGTAYLSKRRTGSNGDSDASLA